MQALQLLTKWEAQNLPHEHVEHTKHVVNQFNKILSDFKATWKANATDQGSSAQSWTSICRRGKKSFESTWGCNQSTKGRKAGNDQDAPTAGCRPESNYVGIYNCLCPQTDGAPLFRMGYRKRRAVIVCNLNPAPQMDDSVRSLEYVAINTALDAMQTATSD